MFQKLRKLQSNKRKFFKSLISFVSFVIKHLIYRNKKKKKNSMHNDRCIDRSKLTKLEKLNVPSFVVESLVNIIDTISQFHRDHRKWKRYTC